MSMVPSVRDSSNNGGVPPSFWIDSNTIKNAQCVVSNIFLEQKNFSFPCTILTNLPLSVYNTVQAFKDQSYWKIAFDVISFSSLFFPAGRKIAVVIDCTSEVVNIYKKFQSNGGTLDCTIRENALKVLGLSEAEAQNRTVLDQRYQELCEEWDKRIELSRASSPHIKEI